MDESAAVKLAMDAYSTMQGIGEDVAQLKGINSDVLALLAEIRDAVPTEVPAAEPLDVSALLAQADEPSSPGFPADDLMSFQYMHTVLLAFMLLAFLLNLGATLWLAFSDKWRS